MTKTLMIALAFVSAIAGFGAVGQAQAASRSVMMSTQTFENRCISHDGVFAGGGDNYGCQLGELTMECTFFAANADCEWNGKSEQVAVVRLIGMPDYSSLSQAGSNGGSPTGGQGGGMKNEQVAEKLREAKF